MKAATGAVRLPPPSSAALPTTFPPVGNVQSRPNPAPTPAASEPVARMLPEVAPNMGQGVPWPAASASASDAASRRTIAHRAGRAQRTTHSTWQPRRKSKNAQSRANQAPRDAPMRKVALWEAFLDASEGI